MWDFRSSWPNHCEGGFFFVESQGSDTGGTPVACIRLLAVAVEWIRLRCKPVHKVGVLSVKVIVPPTPAKELACVLDEEKLRTREPSNTRIGPANLLCPSGWNERQVRSRHGVIEAVCCLDADEKAVARLDGVDNLGENSPCENKVVPRGALWLALLVVVHWPLNKIVERCIAPESFAVDVGRPEKNLGQRIESSVVPFGVDEALGNDVARVLGIVKVLLD
jgi:hypothetical protein